VRQPTRSCASCFVVSEWALTENWAAVPFSAAFRGKPRGLQIPQIAASKVRPSGRWPVVGQGAGQIEGYTDDRSLLFPVELLPVILYGPHTRRVKLVTDPFVAGPNVRFIWPTAGYDTDFAYYMALAVDVPSRGYNDHFTMFKQQTFPRPPLLEQQAIAGVLRAIRQATEATEQVIAAARVLRRTVSNVLLDGMWDQRGHGETVASGNLPERRAVELGSVANISTGTTPSTARPDYHLGKTPFVRTAEIANNIITRAQAWVSDLAIADYRLKVYQPGTVFLAMYGQGKTRGQVALLGIEATTSQNTAAIVPGPDLDSRYLWLYLLSRYQSLRSDGMQGHISHLNLGFVQRLVVPLPSLAKQRDIASILTAVDRKIAAEEHRRGALGALFARLLDDLMSARLRVQPS